MSAAAEIVTSPWTARAQRAEELRERYPFAAELLALYLALVPVQEDVWRTTRKSPPQPAELARWAAIRVLPAVVEATVAAGPATLRDAVVSRFADDAVDDALAGWLAGEELDPVDRYLARASLAPALEALGEQAAEACVPELGADALCPSCGGRPQLSCVADSGEALVSGRRSLLCSRCGSSWAHTRSACPACGESDEARLLVYAERWEGAVSGNGSGDGAGQAVFPNLRIAGCESCRRYLIEVDMARDGRAVPEVDELAAVPLDLYAADEGLTKVTPNLMGF
jgi:Protein involved in formate dehydrogenase formation